MGSYAPARASLQRRSRRATYDRRGLCLLGEPARRCLGVELAFARQTGEIASTQSGHGRRRRSLDGRAARRVLAAALTVSYTDNFLGRERDGCLVRLESTVLRQNAAVAQPVPITAAARLQSAPASQILTYISIGFWRNLIYAAGSVGVDHNMLSDRGAWAHRRLQPPTGRRRVSADRAIRTLATKCWHNGRSLSGRRAILGTRGREPEDCNWLGTGGPTLGKST